VVSHESALVLHGLSDVLPNTVHLLVSREHRGVRAPTGVTLHTATAPIPDGDITTRHGIRVTIPARTIIDAARSGTAPEQIQMAVRQALQDAGGGSAVGSGWRSRVLNVVARLACRRSARRRPRGRGPVRAPQQTSVCQLTSGQRTPKRSTARWGKQSPRRSPSFGRRDYVTSLRRSPYRRRTPTRPFTQTF